MATDIVSSLFGTTPEMYQAAQRQQAQQQALEMAKLDPFQRATAGLQMAGYDLGQGIGGAMGIQDPQLQVVARTQELLKTVNPNNPDSLAKAAQIAAQFNPQLASALADKATKLMGDLTKQAQESAAATASLAGAKEKEFSMSDLGRGQKLAETGKFTPESIVAALQAKDLSKLVPVDKMTKPTADFVAKAVELGFGDKASYGQYSSDQVKAINTALFDEDIKKKAAGAAVTRVSVDVKGEEEFIKTLGGIEAKRVGDALTARDNAIKELGTLQKMAEVSQRPIITGSFAEQRADVSNFFNTIGISSSADKLKTANSQEYIKYSTGLVLDNLKKTGYNPSNRDMQVVQSIIPRLETDPIARKELINFMATKAQEVVDETTRMYEYGRKNKGLSGYTPKVPLVAFSSGATNPYSGLSDSELAARIAAARAAQK